MRAALLPLLVVVLLAPWPRAAHAADPAPQIALRLNYVLGPGAKRCPSEEIFRDEVAAKMGYDPFTLDAPERVVITLTRSTRGSTVTVAFNDAARAHGWDDQTLTISDDNCVELVMGAALYLTIVFLPFPSPPSTAIPPPSPSAASSPAVPPDPPKVEPPSPSAPVSAKVEPAPSVPLSPPGPPPEHRRSLQGRVGLGGALALKSTPQTFSGELTLNAGILWHRWSLDGELRWHPWVGGEPVSGWAVGDAKPIASRLALLVVPCGRTQWLKQWFFGCGLLGAAAQMFGKNGAATGTTTETHWSAALGLRVGLDVPLGSERLALRASLDALATPPTYAITYDKNTLWRTSAVTGAAGMGVVTTF